MNHTFIPFKKEDITQERFYRVPKAFVEDDYFKIELDSNMKLMYSLLRDRYELSIQNKWFDKSDSVYCIYSRENLSSDLNVSKNTISKCIKKLTDLNLMKEVRNGQGKPNHMYISKVEPSHGGRSEKIGIQEDEKLTPNDTDISETEKIKRHTITNNGDYVFLYYAYKYQNLMRKEHPTVTGEQLRRMNDLVDDYRAKYAVNNEEWEGAIDEHLKTLSDKNNGNILSFLSGDTDNSPLLRYLNVK